jgi:hypothetical protein
LFRQLRVVALLLLLLLVLLLLPPAVMVPRVGRQGKRARGQERRRSIGSPASLLRARAQRRPLSSAGACAGARGVLKRREGLKRRAGLKRAGLKRREGARGRAVTADRVAVASLAGCCVGSGMPPLGWVWPLLLLDLGMLDLDPSPLVLLPSLSLVLVSLPGLPKGGVRGGCGRCRQW